MKLTVWCNAEFDWNARTAFEAALERHSLVWAAQETGNLGSTGPDPALTGADIAFGQPDPKQVIDLPDLKWVHLTSAGYTRYDRDDLRKELRARGATLTNSSSVYDEPCAQHLLAFMLAQARLLPQAMAAQVRGEGWTYEQLRPKARVLRDETVLILGYGAIARRLAELLAPFGLRIIGFRRAPAGSERVPVHPIADLDRFLPQADHVVSALPANPSTHHLINRHRLGLMKAGAGFYNVGRGNVVDQEALQHALKERHLGFAYLDVTDPEPLPTKHPLWTDPNCFITPHVGGGMNEESSALVQHFLRNLSRFEAGEPLLDRVM